MHNMGWEMALDGVFAPYEADTRVGNLLPLAGSAVADVTLAELASHRSGLPRQSTRLRDVVQFDLRYLANRDPFVQDAAGVIAQARAAPLRTRGTVDNVRLSKAWTSAISTWCVPDTCGSQDSSLAVARVISTALEIH